MERYFYLSNYFREYFYLSSFGRLLLLSYFSEVLVTALGIPSQIGGYTTAVSCAVTLQWHLAA